MNTRLVGLVVVPVLSIALVTGCLAITPDAPSPSFSPSPSSTLDITPTPSPSPSPSPSPTPTVEPTASPSATPSPTASAIATATATATSTSSNQLSFTAEPNFGRLELTSGFLPDPTTKELLSGGSVDASYLGGGCSGFATSAPDYSVRYTVQGFSSLLRLYFEGAGDTTLIINDPLGNWLCNDDSYGTVSPTIDIPNPNSGRYDIWVGSFVSGQAVNGTLSITELDGNHPSN